MRSHRSTKRLPEGNEQERSDPQWVEDSLSHVKELSERVTELSTLMGVSALLSSDGPLTEVLDSVCRLSAEICRAQVCFIHLSDGDDDLVCIGRHLPSDSVQYAWEGITRIYGRKAIQKEEIVSCSNLLLRREGPQQQERRDSRMGGICAVPLKGRSRVVGAMAVGYPTTHRFSAREKDMLNAIAAQVAVVVERSWLMDQLQEQLARANSLREVSARIGSNLELDAVLDSIVTHASRLLAAEFSAIFLVDRPRCGVAATEGQVGVIEGHGGATEGHGGERGRVNGCAVQLEEGPLGDAVQQAVETARPAVAHSPHREPTLKPPSEMKPDDYRVALAVPLISGQEVVGALVTCYQEKRRFDPSDISLAEDFARQAALAIRNARLYEDAMENRLSLEAAINQINNHGISLMDADLNLRFANPATYWLLGLSPRKGELPLEEWSALARKGLARGSQLDQLVELIRANPEKTVVADFLARGAADSHRALRLHSLPLRQMDGTVKGRVNVLEEGR